jgi:alpha,alpha-trehalose phosphorylase
VIEHPAFEVDPWAIRESHLDLDMLGQTESIFALSNGHVGMRANLDEGYPHVLPGTYLSSFYEVRPLPYPEGGYGYPEAGQTILNVTDGKTIRLLVEDEPFDVRYGKVLAHERTLDLRAGVLRRRTDWRSPTGSKLSVSSTRLVSFAQRAVAAILYEVEPLDGPTNLVMQSELVANEPLPAASGDPRAAAALESPLVSEQFTDRDHRAVLLHRTRASGLLIGAGMDHVVDCPQQMRTGIGSEPDLARLTVATVLRPGEKLRVVKFLAYGWSSQRTAPSIRDQVEGALAAALLRGWDGLLADQRAYLDDFWRRADVELEGDPELQQAVRFALFHVLQSAARTEQRAIPAKGLTGPGYDGHTFWDTETFVLPLLTYTAPAAARDALRWRHSTLELAQDRARQLGFKGAAFPWRTIRGQECSGYWPAGTAAFHINADIAAAAVRYMKATGDEEFEREVGLELLVETARLWRSLGHHDEQGRFRIDGVTGPDEYSAIADNNVYTNLMAQANLRAAADAAERMHGRAVELGVDAEEMAAWRDAADAVLVPFDEALGVHPQAEGLTRHQRWDFSNTGPAGYPLLLHFPYFDIYRKQVVKQADLVLALHLCGYAFTDEQKARDFAYYEELTVRDSSLSASTQAVVAAEVGQLDLAYDYFAEAAFMDVHDLEHNVRDGLHMASLAGAWSAAVCGFGGMRDYGGALHFAPRLPMSLERLVFRVTFRGSLIKVEVDSGQASYSLLDGAALEVTHYDQAVEVVSRPTSLPIPAVQPRPRPSQPPGREPVPRSRRGS